MSLRAKIYIASVIAAGMVAVTAAFLTPASIDWRRFLTFVAMAAIASAIRLRLPWSGGAYSLNAVLLLAGAVYYSLAETVSAACVAGAVATLANARKRPLVLHVLFNAAGEAASLALCWFAGHWLAGFVTYRPALLAAVAALYFVTNTMLVSGVLAELEGKPLWAVGRQWYFWSFPVYLTGAAVIGLLPLGGQRLDGPALIVLLPLLYLIHFFCALSLHCPTGESAGKEDDPIPARARIYLAVIITGGVGALAYSLLQWDGTDPVRFALFLALAIVTAAWKVPLPGLTGAISVNYVIVLFAIASMSLGEAVVMSAAGAVVQTLWKPKHRPKPVQVWFNLACFVLSTCLAYGVCREVLEPVTSQSLLFLLVIATVLHYGLNTVLVAGVLTLVEGQSFSAIWQHCHFWAFPHYAVGAVAAGLMTTAGRMGHWMQPLLIVPLLAMVCISYIVQVREHSFVANRA